MEAMVTTMVTDIMAILMATTIEAMVTGIMVIVVQGMARVIGDEIKPHRESLYSLRLSPCGADIPTPITPTYLFRRPSRFPPCLRPARRDFAQAVENPL